MIGAHDLSWFLPKRDPHANPQILDRFDCGHGWTLLVTGFSVYPFQARTLVSYQLQFEPEMHNGRPRFFKSDGVLDLEQFRRYVKPLAVLP